MGPRHAAHLEAASVSRLDGHNQRAGTSRHVPSSSRRTAARRRQVRSCRRGMPAAVAPRPEQTATYDDSSRRAECCGASSTRGRSGAARAGTGMKRSESVDSENGSAGCATARTCRNMSIDNTGRKVRRSGLLLDCDSARFGSGAGQPNEVGGDGVNRSSTRCKPKNPFKSTMCVFTTQDVYCALA